MNPEALDRLSKAFSPSAPIAKRDLFLGRIKQLRKVVDTVLEKGQHFVLFGERGVGKTSLANIVHDDLSNVIVSKVTCSREDSFRNIWTKALGRVKFEEVRSGIGYKAEKRTEEVQLDMFLPGKDDITSLDVLHTLERVKNHLLFIFDEFDAITSLNTKAAFADTIKCLSDNAQHVTIGVVGVAKDVTSLIGCHPSLERCIRQIHLPRMSDSETEAIVIKGFATVGVRVDASVVRKIIDFSLGFPHFTHLLCKYAGVSALHRDADEVGDQDFAHAVGEAIENASQSIQDVYRAATDSTFDGSKFSNALGACALAPVDQYGAFTAKAFAAQYLVIAKQALTPQMANYYLNELCSEGRGSVLEKLGHAKKRKYSFRSPLIKAYTRFNLYKAGHIHQSLLPI